MVSGLKAHTGIVSNRRNRMGLFRKFVNNTRKPEGLLGSIMIWGMNIGHARMAKWGMNHQRGLVEWVAFLL